MMVGVLRRVVPFVTVTLGSALACSSGSEPGGLTGSGAPDVAAKSQAICPIGPAFPSCYGKCGALVCSPIDPNACCSCDDGCVARGDCCCDFEDHCPQSEPTSCEGHCGGSSPDGCECDAGCMGRGDCCDDFATACASCEGFCGGSAPTGCFCDALCTGFGDCCSDFAGECVDFPKTVPLGASARGMVIAADTVDNLYLAANVAGTWDPGGGPIATTANDALLVSWDALGTFRWATRLTSDGGKVFVRALEVSGNNLYAVGQFTGGTLRRNGTAILAKPSGSTTAGFAVALNRNTGVSTWAATRTGYSHGSFNDVESDGAGNLVTAGDVTALIFRFGQFVSYTPSGGFRWQRPSTLELPYQRLTLDGQANTYVLTASSSTYGISSYAASGTPRWSGAELVGGAIHDIAAHPTRVFAVGYCSTGCKIDGVGIAEGGLVTNFLPDSGVRHLIVTYSRVTHFNRVELESSGRLAVLGHFATGPVDVGGGDLGTSSQGGVFTMTLHHGGAHLASRLVATVPSSAVIEPGDLALANGVQRYASVSANAPVTVDGTVHDTTAPWNGVVVRLP
ncbi:MAG TPA: hypothetical protein VKY73_03765 [Polyangiaceae bacterium]|nr:hypothetical protein [Polyangiaceae bacterium]